MADGLFDDLVPKNKRQEGGLFDDLLPADFTNVRGTPADRQGVVQLGDVQPVGADEVIVPDPYFDAAVADIGLDRVRPNFGTPNFAPAGPFTTSRYDTGAIRETTERPDRGLGETMMDIGRAARTGARNAVIAGADLPRQAINTLNTGLNYAADGLAGTFGGDAGPGVPMIQQPGWLAELEANAATLSERERRMTASAASEFDAANMPSGFVQTLGYLYENPGALLEPAAQSAPSMLLGGAVGRVARSGSVGIAAGAAEQASQSARAVEAALLEKGVPPELAANLATQAFANAGAIGVLAPRLVPGGRSFEDVIAGTLGRGTGGMTARAAVPLLGEPVSEALEEGSIQANQNLYSGEPIGKGVGGAAALGGLLGFGMGAPGAVVEGSRALTESREQRNLRIAQDERAPIEERLAAVIELATAGAPQTQDATPSNAITPTPAPATPAPTAVAPPAPLPNLGDLGAEDTSDLDTLLTQALTPEMLDAARAALGDVPTESAPPAAAPPVGPVSPATPAAQSFPPQPDTPRAPESAEPAASLPEPRAPVPATPTPAQAGQAPAEQSAPVSAGADLAAAPPKPARARAVKVDKNRKPMDMLRVIAANGGLNREAFRRTGVDPAEFTRRAGFNYVFRKEGGMTPSDLREFMQQEGYLQRDSEFGRAEVDDNDAVDLFDRAFRGGEEIYSDDQAEAVAEMRRAREAADAEFRGEVASLPEFADFDPFESDPVTAEFTSEIARLTERAYDLGATDEEIVGAAFDSDVAGDRIVALQDMIERLEREQADIEQGADAGAPARGAEPGQAAEPEPGLGDFALEVQPAETPAAEAVAPSPDSFTLSPQVKTQDVEDDAARRALSRQQTGLFGAGEARRAADEQRDAQTRNAPAPSVGGGLFAGNRPAQARVDETPSKVDAALSRWNRSPAGLDFRNAGARERESFERGFRAGYEGGSFPREAVANRAMDRGWQAGQKFAEIDENTANGMEFTESGELRPIRPEPLESVEDAPFYSAAFRRWADDAPVVTPAMAMDYEFRTGDKVVLAAFHGTKRPDRIGKGFNAKRATSGPMAYFTSAPDVASNYAKGKNDTSLAYEDTEFATWFKVKVKGARNPVAIDRAWWSLEPEDRQRIAALAPRVMLDDDAENVVLGDEGRTSGLGNYEWELKQARGNHLRALVESWLSSGSIYDNEQQFMDVLAKAGMPMDGVTYDSPNAEFPAVFPVHIAMRNPLVSTDIPAEVMGRLRDSAKRDRSRAKNDGADGWDKRTTTLREWVADLEAGNDYVWTRIPDKVTDVLRAAGYDGIIDMGGKGGGPRHRVYVPFAEGQVKSVFNKGRYDESKRDLLETLSDDELTDADLTHAERAAFARQSAAMREQDEDADLQAELARMSREQGAEDADRLGLRAAVEAAVGSSPVTYLRGYDGLPDNLRTSVERRNSMGRHGRTAGLYDPATGTVYLFTDVVSTPERAAFTAAHEIAGHHGLRRLLGDDLDRALEIALQNPTVARLAEEIASQRKLRPDQRMLAAEESLAELAAAVRTGDYGHIADRYGVEVPTGIRERVKAAIENFLRRLKALFDRKSVAFTDADVRELLENAWQAAAGRATLFPNQPLRSAAPEQTETAAFRRWFGDSKVVDADGKPLVVYHGSHEAWEQMLSPEQRMGRFDDNVRGLPEQYWRQEREVLARSAGAVWFTDSEYVADGYAGQRDGDQVVRPFYLSIRNPLDFRDMDSEEAGRILAEAFGEPVAVGTEYGRDKGIAHAIVRDNSRVVAYARANGYDGLIYPDTDVYGRGVHTSFVALNPGQAKSATANRGTFDPSSPSILESVEDPIPSDATGRSIIESGRLLSLIDAAKAKGLDLAELRAAHKSNSARAFVQAIDDLLAQVHSTPEMRVTGTKNAVTDAERAAANRHPILREAAKSNESTLYEAMHTVAGDPLAGREATERLARGGVDGISLADEAVLLVYKTELLNKRDAAEKKLADPNASEDAKAVARKAWEEAEAEIAAVDISAVNAGREWGRFGQFRQRMLRADFTLEALERKERARLERPLTADESATIKAMADKIADLQAKVDALQRRVANAASESAYEGLTREMARAPKGRKSVEYLRQAANDARARLKAAQSVPSRRSQSGAIMSPAVFYDYAVIGAYHIANGAAKFADWVDAMRADLGDVFDRIKAEHPNIFKAAQRELDKPLKADATVDEVLEKIDPANLKPSDVRKLAKAHIGEGVRGEVALIEAMAADLGLAADEVRALFVQSDARREPTMDEAKAELASLRKYIALQNEIDRLEAGVPKPPRAAPRADSPAVAAKKQELADLRKSLRPVRDPDGRYQELRGKQIQKRIDELRGRIAKGDFAARPRIPRALNEANQRAQFELEKAKHDFLRHQFEDNLRKRTPIGKVFGAVGDTFNLARVMMTSIDLSAILRQGGFISYGHPLRALSSVGPSLRAFVSEQAEHRVKTEIEARPNAPLYKKYGLQLTGIGAGPLTQIEEVYASRWLGRFPTWLGGGLVRGSGRSYTAFLNKLRADSFDAMAAALGRRATLTEAEGKAIAAYINVATGRGKIGTKENAGQALNTVFFAPRLVASRFQLLVGQPLYGGNARTRKMIAVEYARFLIGVSVATSLAAFAFGDDEDEDRPLVGLDPRSADFGKVRIGNTYLDPLAGLAQVTTLLARLATGETVSGSGKVTPLRPEYTLTDLRRALGADIPAHELGKDGKLPFGGSSAASVIGRFIRTKLAPVPGAIVNTLAGTNLIGERMTPAEAGLQLVVPMSFQNIGDVMEEHGVPKGTAITTLGLLGMGVQHRLESNAQQFADFNEGLKSVQADVKDRLAALPVEQWPTALEAMKKEYGGPMAGVELEFYKADGKYGQAGEPKRDKDGKPVLTSNRIADDYRDALRDSLVASGMSESEADAAMDGRQVHHIIPDNLARHHPLMAQARKLGYDLDAPSNLIAMSGAKANGEIAHKTSHPEYDAMVFGALNDAEKRLKKAHGSLQDAPRPAVLDEVRKIEAAMRRKIESKDVPTKDGRLAALESRRGWPG